MHDCFDSIGQSVGQSSLNHLVASAGHRPKILCPTPQYYGVNITWPSFLGPQINHCLGSSWLISSCYQKLYAERYQIQWSSSLWASLKLTLCYIIIITDTNVGVAIQLCMITCQYICQRKSYNVAQNPDNRYCVMIASLKNALILFGQCLREYLVLKNV